MSDYVELELMLKSGATFGRPKKEKPLECLDRLFGLAMKEFSKPLTRSVTTELSQSNKLLKKDNNLDEISLKEDDNLNELRSSSKVSKKRNNLYEIPLNEDDNLNESNRSNTVSKKNDDLYKKIAQTILKLKQEKDLNKAIALIKQNEKFFNEVVKQILLQKESNSLIAKDWKLFFFLALAKAESITLIGQNKRSSQSKQADENQLCELYKAIGERILVCNDNKGIDYIEEVSPKILEKVCSYVTEKREKMIENLYDFYAERENRLSYVEDNNKNSNTKSNSKLERVTQKALKSDSQFSGNLPEKSKNNFDTLKILLTPTYVNNSGQSYSAKTMLKHEVSSINKFKEKFKDETGKEIRESGSMFARILVALVGKDIVAVVAKAIPIIGFWPELEEKRATVINDVEQSRPTNKKNL